MHPPERIGRYRLQRRLGSGAFATVWLAHDDELDALVAVKVLADNWSHRLDVRERFLSEARLLRRAGSSRVVQVYDIGELDDARPYFVMEYADGGTLADLCADGPLPVPEALELTALAARGAAALHEAGIVHRDIKPTNLLLRTAPDGGRRLLLADLGLAKSLAQASALTLAAGSAGYQPRSRPSRARASTSAPTSTAWARWATSCSPGPYRARRARWCRRAACGRTWTQAWSGRCCGRWNRTGSGAGRPRGRSRTSWTGWRRVPAGHGGPARYGADARSSRSRPRWPWWRPGAR